MRAYVFPFNAAKIPAKLRRGDRAKIQAEFYDAMRPVLLFRFLVYLMLEVANLASVVSQVPLIVLPSDNVLLSENVSFQIWFLDVFLHHSFTRSGLEVGRWLFSDPANREDTMILLFPRKVKVVLCRS